MKRKEENKQENMSFKPLDGMSTQLQQKMKGNTFSVPAGYFDSLPGKIQTQITKKPKQVLIRPFPRQLFLVASAAAVLIIISLAIFLRSEILEKRASLITQNKKSSGALISETSDAMKVESSASEPVPASQENIMRSASTGKTDKKKQVELQINSVTDNLTADQNVDQFITTLEKEGVTEDDIYNYLIDENVDPIDLTF